MDVGVCIDVLLIKAAHRERQASQRAPGVPQSHRSGRPQESAPGNGEAVDFAGPASSWEDTAQRYYLAQDRAANDD